MADGNLFDNRYQVQSLLGRGGMGTVLKCNDTILGKTVAIKVLTEQVSQSLAIRFQQEARAISKLKHPNIVEIINFGCADSGELFLVMEFIDGVGLDCLSGLKSSSGCISPKPAN